MTRSRPFTTRMNSVWVSCQWREVVQHDFAGIEIRVRLLEDGAGKLNVTSPLGRFNFIAGREVVSVRAILTVGNEISCGKYAGEKSRSSGSGVPLLIARQEILVVQASEA